MKLYIPVTFGFLAVAFYVMSGGSDFVPETRPVAEAEPATTQPAEVVTRAETDATLAALTDVPLIAPLQDSDADAVAAEVATALAAPTAAETPAAEPEAAPVVEAAVAPAADLRAVNATLANLREGPGTDFGVVDKLPQGTQVEVIEVGTDDWVRLRVVGSGIEGWIAGRLLSATNI